MDLSDAPDRLTALAAVAWTWAADFLPRLAAALLLLLVGIFVARWAARGVARLATTSAHVDPTLHPTLKAIVRYGITIVVLVAALSQLGIQTTSILAVLGAAGLAIGLALQGTLANIAAGLMLLWLRPFRAGEYIDNGTVAGTVKEIGLFVTRLDTYDGVFRSVPNSQLWGAPVLNYSRNATRMIDVRITITYDSDVEAAQALLLDLLKAEPRVLPVPGPEVFVDSLSDNGFALAFRGWTARADFDTVKRRLVVAATRRLEAAGIAIARPQRIVQIVGEAARAPAEGGPPAPQAERPRSSADQPN